MSTEQQEIQVETSVNPSLEADVQAFIANIEKEYAAEGLDDQIAAMGEPKVQGGTESSTTKQEVAPPVTTETTKTPVDQGLERLVAREVEIRAREEAFAKRETEYKAMESRLQAAEAKKLPDNLLTSLRTSPSATLTAMGLDPDDLVRMAIAEKMEKSGGKVPQELNQALEKNKTQRQIEALEQKVISQERERAQREFFDRTNTSARQYVTTGLSKDVPTVAEVAKVAPDRVHQEIMQEIITDAQIRGPREPNGDLISFEEAAKRVEARWDAFKKLLSPAQLASTTDSKTTVSGTTATQQPKPQLQTPVVKPPDKPLQPWQVRSDIEEEGIRAALMEYKRVESGRNQ